MEAESDRFLDMIISLATRDSRIQPGSIATLMSKLSPEQLAQMKEAVEWAIADRE
jgi:hypothetical protein